MDGYTDLPAEAILAAVRYADAHPLVEHPDARTLAQESWDQTHRMRFLVDGCLPHETVGRLVTHGSPDAGHPIHIGLRGRRDDQIVAHALAEHRTILTSNAADYRRLLSRQPVHAGGILLPNVDKEASWRLITVALAFLELQPRPVDWMVDRVVEVSADEGICPYELPSGGEPSGTLRHVSGCDLQPVPRPLQLAVIVPT